MRFVQWSRILPPSASVIYSTLAIPDCERDSLNREIAQIALRTGRFIDVEWCEDDSKYVVTLFKDEFEDYLVQISCETPSDVVETVSDLAQKYSEPSSSTSASSYENTELTTI